MKKFILMLATLLCGTCVQAQKVYTLKGRVETSDGTGIPYANAILYSEDSLFITGTSTDEKGKFGLEAADGKYYLRISCIGYKSLFYLLGTLTHSKETTDFILTPDAVAIDEITVKGSNVIRTSDRQIIFPSEQQVKQSVNGLELTQRLALPRVFIDATKQSISMAGNETVQLRINGVVADVQEVLALAPQDIKRIEYHDNPGLRYGDGIGAVIDYLTIQRISGGNIGLSLLQQTNSIGLDQLYGNFHKGKSSFGFNYYTNFHSYNDVYQNKQEHFSFPDGTSIERITQGNPDKQGEILHLGNASYNYSIDENFILSAKFSLLKYDVHTARSHGEVFNAGSPNYRISRKTEEPHWWNRPSLDIYLFKKLKNKQSIAFDLVGTYNGTHQKSLLQDGRMNAIFTDISTDVHSKRYSFIAEGIYEKDWGNNCLTAGIKYTQGKNDNTYKGSAYYETHMRDADTYTYVEFTGKQNKLTYTLGIGTAYTYINQKEGVILNQWNARPTIKLFYAFNNIYSLRFRYLLRNQNPSLSELSAVEQPTDSLLILKGNPMLNSNLEHTFGLNFDINKANCKIGISLAYSLKSHPVMEETFYDTSRKLFIMTYANQRRFEKLNTEIYGNINLFNEHLNLYFNAGFNHFISKGNTYTHLYTDLYYIAQALANYKSFTLTAQFIRQEHLFYGESMEPRNMYNQCMLGYKLRNGMNFSFGISNPFGEYGHYDKEKYSTLAQWKEQNHYPSLKRCLLFSFSYSMNFGKYHKTFTQKIENSDSENGILK